MIHAYTCRSPDDSIYDTSWSYIFHPMMWSFATIFEDIGRYNSIRHSRACNMYSNQSTQILVNIYNIGTIEYLLQWWHVCTLYGKEKKIVKLIDFERENVGTKINCLVYVDDILYT